MALIATVWRFPDPTGLVTLTPAPPGEHHRLLERTEEQGLQLVGITWRV